MNHVVVINGLSIDSDHVSCSFIVEESINDLINILEEHKAIEVSESGMLWM